MRGSRSTACTRESPARLLLSSQEKRILAALSRRPNGLYPVTSVATAAGLAEPEVLPALENLLERELITADRENILAQTVTSEVVWRLAIGNAWFGLAGEIRRIVLPEPPPEPMGSRLPERFRHLFWSGDPSMIRLPRDAAFVAEQILQRNDIGAWGWAVTTLPSDALERVAAKRTTLPATRAIIRNAVAERDAVAA
ncbi:MAG: hypothetical protein OXE75_01590 [bacterium]|nr:hypothetical protein [bacterium]